MIAVDWGISTFRAYRVDQTGAVLDRLEAPLGVLQVQPGTFPGAFEKLVAAWLATNQGPIMLSGMVGSRHGWLEVPYVACPAGIQEIAAGVQEVRWGNHKAWIVPGVTAKDPDGVPDMMRGEETQLLGALGQLPTDAQVCLPGTHSKWVRVRNGQITSFATHMTGEVYAVLKDHSILGRTMTDGPVNPEAFSAGVRRAKDEGGLLHHLFGVRGRALTGDLPANAAASYLSGILIGGELAAAADAGTSVFLLGANALVDLYAMALAVFGFEAIRLDSDSVARGLYSLARQVTAK
ncbi:MAG: 2-dehydro-3-deoxygalactonokinase [Gemmatimonadetes bacterium]|nr:2-dehydro-3-deoxygalactonokinase [Gemmatimonadota bacterium]